METIKRLEKFLEYFFLQNCIDEITRKSDLNDELELILVKRFEILSIGKLGEYFIMRNKILEHLFVLHKNGILKFLEV